MGTNIISAMKNVTETKASERTVRIPSDIHRRLRIAAAHGALTMAAITEQALMAELLRLEAMQPSAAPPEQNETPHATRTSNRPRAR